MARWVARDASNERADGMMDGNAAAKKQVESKRQTVEECLVLLDTVSDKLTNLPRTDSRSATVFRLEALTALTHLIKSLIAYARDVRGDFGVPS
jgi:hypothetical protein